MWVGNKVVNAEAEIIWRSRWYEEVWKSRKNIMNFAVILTLTYWNEGSVENGKEDIYLERYGCVIGYSRHKM